MKPQHYENTVAVQLVQLKAWFVIIHVAHFQRSHVGKKLESRYNDNYYSARDNVIYIRVQNADLYMLMTISCRLSASNERYESINKQLFHLYCYAI